MLRGFLMGRNSSAIHTVFINQSKVITTEGCCHLLTAEQGAWKNLVFPGNFHVCVSQEPGHPLPLAALSERSRSAGQPVVTPQEAAQQQPVRMSRVWLLKLISAVPQQNFPTYLSGYDQQTRQEGRKEDKKGRNKQ